MVLAIESDAGSPRADTAETARPRCLDLALARLGFRPRAEPQPRWRWPATWSRNPRDEIAADWRPV
jgi:hypothetical protein